ncbi:ABC transporter substrate-binding protein [Haloarchaeobius salinus]|uniref:ABC transporter substrate-binding protein n=1 Tax=Haloarchaeobius salinus TaxID=1198298 RepID=UPI002108BF5D|nr:ABC transporter substrate-binding protein [Haloarchaeobius salinus]
MSDDQSLQRRKFLKATGGAATALALAGCTGDNNEDPGGTETQGTDDPGTGTGTEEDDGFEESDRTLQLTNATMSTLDPIASTDTANGRVIQQVFDGLMNYPNGEIEVEPLLSTDYEVSEDYTTYTFTLKEDATFHNGDTVTASDFVYSFERLTASPNSRRAYFVTSAMGIEHEMETVTNDEGEEVEQYAPGSLGVTAVDETTLEIQLAAPFHSTLEMLAYTAFGAIPEGLVDDTPGYDGEIGYDEFARNNPISAGPFTFENWETNTMAEVSRFDDYHGDGPLIGGVHWQIITDTDALYNYGQNKNADLPPMPTSKYDPSLVSIEDEDEAGRQLGTYGPMQNGETVEYAAVPTINTFYIGLNAKNVPKPVRQAIAYAMDQHEGVDQVFKGRGEPAYHFSPPRIYPGGTSAYDEHAEQNYPYGYGETRLEDARQVMEDAGYGSNNQYEITFTTYESPTWQGLGTLLRDKLVNAHINMNLEEAPFATLLNRGRNGNLAAYSLGWSMDWPAPDNFWGQLVPDLTDTDREGGARGAYVDWDDVEGGAVDQMNSAWETVQNNQAPNEQAASTRGDAYVQMEEANWEDMVLLPCYHRTDERFVYDWVDIDPYGASGGSRQKYTQATIGERS